MSTEQVDAITDPLLRSMVATAARDLRTYLEANGIEATFNVEGAVWFMVHAVSGPARAAVWNELAALHGSGDVEVDKRYDRDPGAVAWARAKVQQEVDKLRDWQAKDAAAGEKERSDRWRRHVNHLKRTFIGGDGCVIAAFDERLPKLREQLDKETNHHA